MKNNEFQHCFSWSDQGEEVQVRVAISQVDIKIKKDDSLELSPFIVAYFFLLLFITSCTTTHQLNNSSSSLQVNTSNAATGTGFLFSSSDYVITSYHVVHGSKSISVRLTNGELGLE